MIGIKKEAVFFFGKLITSKISTFTNVYEGRHFTGLKNKRPRKKYDQLSRRGSKGRELVLEYFSGTTLVEHIDQLPLNLFASPTSNNYNVYLCHDDVAAQVVNMVKDDLSTSPSKVIEMNPGIGSLTKKLIDFNVRFVKLLEPNEKFTTILKDSLIRYSENVNIENFDLVNFWKLVYQDKFQVPPRVPQLLSEFSRVPWGNERGLKIIGSVMDGKFISFVALDIIRQSKLSSYGRPCLYLCMPPEIWEKYTNDGSHPRRRTTPMSVLFQTIFDCEILGRVSRRAFLPWQTYSVRLNQKELANNEAVMYVVRIEGKKNLFSEVMDEELLEPYWFFLRHILRSQSNRVIQQMECWEPDCGLALIKQGYNVFTYFSDLKPVKIYELYKDFTTWPSFQSSFIPCVENSIVIDYL
ncbi:dimethyladenosine transferase 2, mitochondrial [Diprion similis]|uniref:dimethyladenosine transferase 2, mitochondrial n=1 Tax=Diprion similis TaxID=362088 RepID=UPI001EF84F9B|nr:dimethyladenosine transferase 2, mitochondrial [Diprion similis]